jgi:hypothetical protein
MLIVTITMLQVICEMSLNKKMSSSVFNCEDFFNFCNNYESVKNKKTTESQVCQNLFESYEMVANIFHTKEYIYNIIKGFNVHLYRYLIKE